MAKSNRDRVGTALDHFVAGMRPFIIREMESRHKDQALDKACEYLEQRTHCPVCGKKFVVTRVIPSSVTGKLCPRDKARARKLSRAHTRRRGG